jgi:hypothetical protein
VRAAARPPACSHLHAWPLPPAPRSRQRPEAAREVPPNPQPSRTLHNPPTHPQPTHPTHPPPPPLQTPPQLRRARRLDLRSLVIIRTARIPIIKLQTGPAAGGVVADVSVGDGSGPAAARYVAQQIAAYPPLAPLVLVLKAGGFLWRGGVCLGGGGAGLGV